MGKEFCRAGLGKLRWIEIAVDFQGQRVYYEFSCPEVGCLVSAVLGQKSRVFYSREVNNNFTRFYQLGSYSRGWDGCFSCRFCSCGKRVRLEIFRVRAEKTRVVFDIGNMSHNLVTGELSQPVVFTYTTIKSIGLVASPALECI